ncbi:MAG TPA: MBL fold metallo-hydrolase [Chloroflexota bacterium]|nr:MBL fold metallo-hydrolase [Chloroflexota bacterium]
MRLTVLGASPACQNSDGACSGYLLEQDDTAIVLDCGPGVFARLQRYTRPESVRAVIISHMHADHTLDLMQYRYYLEFLRDLRPEVPRPQLYLPPTGHQRLLGVSAMQDPSPTFFSNTFDLSEYDPTLPLSLGPLSLRFVPVVHIPHTYAMRVSGAGVCAFSADSGPCAGLVEVARDSDLFLCESSNKEHSTYPFHLTPAQAGTYATEAGARSLLLTHRWRLLGDDVTLTQARATYAGPLDIAKEDMRVTIGS